jgi:hypothetical protein
MELRRKAVKLPMVSGEDIRFHGLSMADGLSQTGVLWLSTGKGLYRTVAALASNPPANPVNFPEEPIIVHL